MSPSPFPTLIWDDDDQTTDRRFGIERTVPVTGPGVCHSLLIRHDVDRRIVDALDIVETVAHGRASKAKVKAAAGRIARARFLLEQVAAQNVGWRSRSLGRRSYRLWTSETDYVTGITEDMACLVLARLVSPYAGIGHYGARGGVELVPAGHRVLNGTS